MDFASRIARELNLRAESVKNTLELFNDGCTIPFISRYRKERTGGMNEVEIGEIDKLYKELQEIEKRRDAIVKQIESQGKLTPELLKRINDAQTMTELEDLYLPYKPKRQTKAEKARAMGLEPLAKMIMAQSSNAMLETLAAKFGDDVEASISGAKDIIVEWISEDVRVRNRVRNSFRRGAVITSKVDKKKKDEPDAIKYKDYFDNSEPLSRCSSHRLLAMRRGEREGFLKVKVECEDERCLESIEDLFVKGQFSESNSLVDEAVKSAYKDYVTPAIETEFANLSKEKADEVAIDVFAKNLKQVLLSSPLGEKNVIALDPGFRTGCKVVCLGKNGDMLCHDVVFPHPPVSKTADAEVKLLDLIAKYKTEAISIGDGTASRETEQFVRNALRKAKLDNVEVYVVSESGASIYSASETAREEFPNEDVTVRGAVSIGRRLQDPLAELVKIDPKSIGVGQYQHDVDQKKLKDSLDRVVESAVNMVGVNLNTASKHLLSYVSGLGPALAQAIVNYRTENGMFKSRAELKKVPRLGARAYEQCAGFLRIRGAENPLDNTAVHPESYKIVEKMAKDSKSSVAELIADSSKRKNIDINKYVSDSVGIPTLKDIMNELDKPGLDVRQPLKQFSFADVHEVSDLREGMVVPGIVSNVTNFGAFVNIGVHKDGLLHVSQMNCKRGTDPTTLYHVGQQIEVKVVDVEAKTGRISLAIE